MLVTTNSLNPVLPMHIGETSRSHFPVEKAAQAMEEAINEASETNYAELPERSDEELALYW